MDGLIQLTPNRLALALGLIVMAIAISVWQQLRLEWTLAIATGRTVLQLLAIGYILAIVFSINNPWAVLGILAVMLSIAAIVARNRIDKELAILPMVWGSIFISTVLTMLYVNWVIIRPVQWYNPQYLIPLTGIVLGNAMNAAALAGERFLKAITTGRLEIETYLSLGATPQEAVAQYRRDAIKAGMIPTINAMMVVGIVTLPGIITGQMLSGVSPLNAAAYQMLIMFMLAFVTLTTATLITQGISRYCFNAAMQLDV